MTGISFDSEDLKIDYLSLNLRFNNIERIKEIAHFLANTFNCRSTLYDQSSKKRHLLIENNRCQVLLVKNSVFILTKNNFILN